MRSEFGRKINYLPLAICLIIGAIVGYLLFLLSKQVSIGIFFGILCILACAAIFSINLVSSYGYWRIDDNGIHYYDYDTTSEKLRAILMPSSEQETTIQFKDIKSFALVVGGGMSIPKGIGPKGPIDTSFYVVDAVLESYSNPYFLTVKLNDGREVDLNLSHNVNDSENIKQAINAIETEANTRVSLIKQTV